MVYGRLLTYFNDVVECKNSTTSNIFIYMGTYMKKTLLSVIIFLVLLLPIYAQNDWTTYRKNIVDDITAIALESDTIWLGSYNGMAQYNKITGGSIPYSTENGLIHNEINDIAVDNNGMKWIVTNNDEYQVLMVNHGYRMDRKFLKTLQFLLLQST